MKCPWCQGTGISREPLVYAPRKELADGRVECHGIPVQPHVTERFDPGSAHGCICCYTREQSKSKEAG